MSTNMSIAISSQELGIASSSKLELEATNGKVNRNSGLWPYEEEVNKIGGIEICRQYESYTKEIAGALQPTKVNKIVFAGMESILCDYMCENYKNTYKIIMIPNSPLVDAKRIKMNYDNNNIIVTNPFIACEWATINTIIIVPVFRLSDNTLYAYSYPRRFLGSDVVRYCFRTVAVELLPAIQGLDYRTPPSLELSKIDLELINKIFTFKSQIS